MKVLIHDGLGIWLCARRLNKGKFNWGETWVSVTATPHSQRFSDVIAYPF